jgi:hypothetical protein
LGDISAHFKVSDFQCHCANCAENPARPHTKTPVVLELEVVRAYYGKPILITRGVSCTAHNAAIGGASDSRHLPEHADGVDIRHGGPTDAYQLVAALMKVGCPVIRVYQHHVHADWRPGPRMFLASPNQGAC